MITGPSRHSGRRQRGVVLVTSLLLLVVVTLLAVAMFRSFGLDERIAGNSREKQRALNAAETAEQYAEYWLALGNGYGTTGTNCTTVVDYTVGQICNKTLAAQGIDPTNVPWTNAGAAIGVKYLPTTPATMNVTDPTQSNYYAGTPGFYIAYLGASPMGNGYLFQIDAVGYGGSANTVAVTESTYLIQSGPRDGSSP